MENIIKLNNIELKSRNKGAELFSVIVDGDEYIWNKKEIWAKSSPILFPFVGALKDNKFIYKNKEYIVPTKHGFARDSEFLLLEKKENKISYILSSNENTKKMYPFDFDFIVSYEILNNNSVMMSFEVKNKGDETMYFSLGAHPAFVLPNNYEDYYIEFEKEKKLEVYKLDGVLLDSDKKRYIGESSRLDITDKLFEEDALIFDGEITNISKIKCINSTRTITMKHEGFQYIAYWRPEKSNFICIEPWYGITDKNNTDKILKNKLGIQKLLANQIFTASLIVEFEK